MSKKGTTIFSKILLLMVILSVTSSFLILVVVITQHSNDMTRDLIKQNEMLAQIAARSIESGYINKYLPFETLKQIAESEDILFLWVVKPDGEIYLADDYEMWGKKIKNAPPDIEEIVIKDDIFFKTGEKIKLIILPLNIREQGNRLTLYLGVSLKSLIEFRNKTVATSICFFIMIIIFVVVLSIYFAKSITNPIIKVKNAVKEIAKGNLNIKVKTKSKNEIGQLAKSFNQMVVDLKKYQKKLLKSERKRKIELEDEVAKKTKELNAKITTLKKTRTAMLNMMEDLREANADLKELDKAKTNFLNIVSHELKTPLTAISAHLDILDDTKSNFNKQQRSSLEAIVRNSNQLKILINNILEISRIESKKFELTPELLNLKDLITEVANELRILADKKGLKLIEKIDKLPLIKADRERVKGILNNLILNAIKFTEKGSITIEAKKEGDFVLINITDTGIGIPKDKIKNLFKKFYQVDASLGRRYGGSGLGLSITKQLVKLHGGKISVQSKEGGGTTFSFTLPIKSKKKQKSKKKVKGKK